MWFKKSLIIDKLIGIYTICVFVFVSNLQRIFKFLTFNWTGMGIFYFTKSGYIYLFSYIKLCKSIRHKRERER